MFGAGATGLPGRGAVALYSPLGNEVETAGIRRAALETGKRLYYPRVEDGRSRVIRVRSEAELVPGRHGILEPVGEQALPPGGNAALVVFVPGVAFDRSGNRLGRGSGWYDRFLDDLPIRVPRIALAYEFQVLEGVPVEPGDRLVDIIVTEERVIACQGADGRATMRGETPQRRISVIAVPMLPGGSLFWLHGHHWFWALSWVAW